MKTNTKTPDTSKAGSANAAAKTTDIATKDNMSASAYSSEKKNGKSDSSELEGESLLEKFFHDQLKDIYYAEQQLLKAIPKMEEAATTDELKEAFQDHLHQTQKHVKRLEKAFEKMGKKAEGKKCEAIEGIIKEAESIIKETKEGTMTRDAALIIAAQKVEHYEIATYGGLVQLAMTIHQDDVADLLDKTLREEEETDRHLTDIAEKFINMEAEEETKYSIHKS